MFAGLRRAAAAKKQGRTVRLKFAPRSENKDYDHFTPISGQASAQKLGMSPERLRVEYVSAAEGIKFAEVVKEK